MAAATATSAHFARSVATFIFVLEMASVAVLLILAMVSPLAAERNERFGRSHETKLSPDLEDPTRAVPKEPFSALEHDANMTENADGRLVTGASCSATDLKPKSAKAGAGGNAYVLKLKQDVCGGKAGDILKAFFSDNQDSRDKLATTLAGLPSMPATCGDNGKLLAGLACAAANKEQCLVESKCVNVGGFDRHTESEDCYFVRMKNGGSKTLEDCMGDTTLKKDDVKRLLQKAVMALQCIHSKGYWHGDFQLKNIMVTACNQPSSLKVVDLDAMTDRTTVLDVNLETYWGAGRRAWQDYAMLFGVCETGAAALTALVKSTDAKAQTLAATVQNEAATILNCTKPQTRTWAAVTSKTRGAGKKILDVLR